MQFAVKTVEGVLIMILTGDQIHKEVMGGSIIIDPYDDALMNPNSYNFRLGERILTYEVSGPVDTRVKLPFNEHIIPDEGFILQPGVLYLGHTLEAMGSPYFVPMLGGRSSTGRLGLFVHITAPLGDIGYLGQWTLQFRATVPLTVYKGQKIGQMIFIKPYGLITPYNGRNQGGKGPQSYNPNGLFGVCHNN